MAHKGITPAIFPYTSEEDASDEVKDLYKGIKEALHQPFVPNFVRVFGGSPASIRAFTGMMASLLNGGVIPPPQKLLLFLAIASARNCEYCTSSQLVACRMAGVDQETIEKVAEEAERADVKPQRLQEMVRFAVKASLDPNGITPDDYETLFAVGLSKDECCELVCTAAMFTYAIIVCDSLGIPVDDEYLAILSGQAPG